MSLNWGGQNIRNSFQYNAVQYNPTTNYGPVAMTTKFYNVSESCDLQQGCCIGLNEIVHVYLMNWHTPYIMLINYEIIKS